MASRKVIAVCQSGGEFLKGKDGILSYNGGEAYAIDIDQNTQLSYFKKEVAEMFDFGDADVEVKTIKYFIPGNRRTLITVSKDKDLARMVSFVGDADTVDVFINSEVNDCPQNVSPMLASRSSRTTVTEDGKQDPLPSPIPVSIMEGVHDSDIVDEEVPYSTPFIGSTSSSNGTNHRKAAHHWENAVTGVKNHRMAAYQWENGITDVKNHRKAAHQWENAITGVDQRFGSIDELRDTLSRYALAHGFAYKFKKNDNNRIIANCKAEGCKWRIYAKRLPTTEIICIKKIVNEHTCDGEDVKAGFRASQGWVGSFISEKLKSSSTYRPKDIVDDIQKEFGIQLNYSQAWRARELVKAQLLGAYKEAYGQLPVLCKRIMEVNPGSIAAFSTKEDSTFHRLFISFSASTTGFQQGCRPLIFLDSSPLNSKYQGDMFVASSVDGDDGAFTLAFAIVDTKSADNWQWFLEELKKALSLSEPVTFVADFQNGFGTILANVFTDCVHSYCLRYIIDKFDNDLKGNLAHEPRRLIVSDFFAAAYAILPEEFDQHMNSIKAISREAYDWFLKIEPDKWANAFFPRPRYNLLTSNYGQVFFDWVSGAGDLPITDMIHFLGGKLMSVIYSRRVESNQWGTRLAPSKQEKLEQEIFKAQSLQIGQSNGCMFEVHGDSLHVVDIDNWVCSCKQWQLTGLPCSHSISAILYVDRDPYDYCSKYFTVDCYHLTYAESIEPVPINIGKPVETDGSQEPTTVNPPPARRGKLKTVEQVDLLKRQMQCSKCKGLGHNKKTCKASSEMLHVCE